MDSSAPHREEDILKAAEALFASKGYDGTSVDQIASNANVNKATIYYYFKSKQAILDRLIDDFMQSVIGIIMEYSQMILTEYLPGGLVVRDSMLISVDEGDKDRLLAFTDHYFPAMFDFFESKRDILRVMVMESVKEGENRFLLFKFTDLLSLKHDGSPMMEKLKATGMDIEANHSLMVMKFFGGILPLIFYTIACDSWSEHYDTNRETLRKEMMKLYQLMMAGYMQVGASAFTARAGESGEEHDG